MGGSIPGWITRTFRPWAAGTWASRRERVYSDTHTIAAGRLAIAARSIAVLNSHTTRGSQPGTSRKKRSCTVTTNGWPDSSSGLQSPMCTRSIERASGGITPCS